MKNQIIALNLTIINIIMSWSLFLTHNAMSVPANPSSFQVLQSDGTKITLHLRGDEYFNYIEDEQGFTVIHNGVDYVYAQLNQSGLLMPTAQIVGRVDPETMGIEKGILPQNQNRPQLLLKPLSLPEPIEKIDPRGNVRNLVVMCKFADHDNSHIHPQSEVDILFNEIGGDSQIAPSGSVRDYYLENSYGALDLQSTVLAWVTLPQTEAYYANNESGTGRYSYPQNSQGMVEDALDLVNPLVNFSDFDYDGDGYIDAITIIHSGYGAESGGIELNNRIWSHKWSLWAVSSTGWNSGDVNNSGEPVKVYSYHTEPILRGKSGDKITTIGVICHETGHFFGLPDLYDTDGSSSGIGSWGLMANSWGFDNTGLYPPHFCAWSKIKLGWVNPIALSPGTYSLPEVEWNPIVFRINKGFPTGEYLLIENRQPTGFESIIPQGGLAIWHIDENKSNNRDEGYPGQTAWAENNKHYKVAILQADGYYDLEKRINRGDSGDLYHAGGKAEITTETTPNTDRYQGGVVDFTDNCIVDISASRSNMTFTYNYCAPCPNDTETPVLIGVPSNKTYLCGSYIPPAPEVTATDNCDTDVNIILHTTDIIGYCPQTITRTWTATDTSGNTTSATQTITIEDSTSPVFSNVPGDITLECGDAIPPANPTAMDDCDGMVAVTVVTTESYPTNSSSPDHFVYREWTATDRCGNSVSATQKIIKVDTMPPVFSNVPGDLTLDWCVSPFDLPGVYNATDNCDTNVEIQTHVTYSGNCPEIMTRTWTATDISGNSTSTTQTITINDNAPPYISCLPNLIVTSVPPPDVSSFSVTDCSDVTSVHVGDVTNDNIITRTYRVTDTCGNYSECTQLFTLSSCIPEQVNEFFSPTNSGMYSKYGGSVSLFGNQALIGAEGHNSAYLFDIDSGEELYKFSPPYDESGEFGRSVSLSGDHVLISAINTFIPTGNAYLFDVKTGEKLYKFSPSEGTEFNYFGQSVSLSGDYALIGSPYEEETGAAYLFDVKTGEKMYRFTPSDGDVAQFDDNFGYSVSLSENYALIGFPYSDSTKGSAYLFDVKTGEELYKFSPSEDKEFDHFGEAVSLLGDYALISSSSGNDCGYLFDVTTGNQLNKFVCPEDGYGQGFPSQNYLSLSESYALIGSKNANFYGEIVGTAYLFDLSTGKQLHKFVPPEDAESHFFGDSVSLSEEYVLIGSPQDINQSSIFDTAYLYNFCPVDNCENDTETPILIGVPPSETLECGENVQEAPTVTATDNCDTNVVVKMDEISSGECPEYIKRTWTATDSSGNTTSATQSITIEDTTPPNITYASTLIVTSVPPPDVSSLSVIDCSDITSLHVGDVTNDNIITRTYRVTDICGNHSECTQVFTLLSCAPQQVHKLHSPNSGEFSFFGQSVSQFGNYALIGTLFERSAYLFDITTGEEVNKFSVPVTSVSGNGVYVSLFGNYALIGAPEPVGPGSAYLFDVKTGNELYKFFSSDGKHNDSFGASVSLSGNHALIGARGNDYGPGYGSGSAFLFDVETGDELYKFFPSDGEAYDFFGQSVSLSGNHALIGANGNGDSGAAYLFDVNTKKSLRKFIPSPSSKVIDFGHSVSLSGNYALIGAKGDNVNAYLFDINTGIQLKQFILPDSADFNSYYNSTVALSGNYALIGSYDDKGNGSNSGATYLFDINTGKQLHKFLTSDGESGDNFGESVSLSEKYALIGAPKENDKVLLSGSAYIFNLCPDNKCQDDSEAPILKGVPDNMWLGCEDAYPPVSTNVTAVDNCDVDVTIVMIEDDTFKESYITRIWIATDDAGNSVTNARAIIKMCSFSDWVSMKGLSGEKTKPLADANGDGIVNLLEYALDNKGVNIEKGIPLYPSFRQTTDDLLAQVSFELPDTFKEDITYRLQKTETLEEKPKWETISEKIGLGDWTPAGSVNSKAGSQGHLLYTVSIPMNGDTSRYFFRLQIELTP